MIRSIWAALFLFMTLLLAAPAFATSDGFVVSSCPGTLGVNAYTAGQFGAITIDVNGNQCVAPTGAGTASAVNITQVLGAAPSATNPLFVATGDPCTSAAKSSAAINITTATTTALVAVSGSTTVYVCGFSITIAPSATTADVAAFEYGSGVACATSPISLTGGFGNGDLTTASPVVPVSYGGGGATIFKSAASNGVCMITAGTTVNVQGVLTYVQQ
jgi:hypothetical protein